jgi:hypothetical protein
MHDPMTAVAAGLMDRSSVALTAQAAKRWVLVVMVCLASAMPACWLLPLTSDARLEAVFRRNKGDFETLVRMSNEDSRFRRISLEFTHPRDHAGFPQARWTEYRRLFKKLGLEAGITREGPPTTIFFDATGRGFVFGEEIKGYVYSETPPSPLVKSLDHGIPPEVPVDPHGTWAFKVIEKNWYLYYSEY